MPFESSKTDNTAKPEAKKPKPRSLPPPGEAFGANKGAQKKNTAANPVAKKPAAAAKTAAKPKASEKNTTSKPKAPTKKSQDGGQVEAGNGVTKPAAAKTPAERARPAKRPSIFTHLLGESYSFDIFQGTSKKNTEPKGVLMRRTAASQRIRDDMDKAFIIRKPGMTHTIATEAKKGTGSETPFPVMDLPKELRAMLWRHAVVSTRAFIWPERNTGHEQPDLAMTCRLVREELLPIFYAENIFAINLSPENEPSYHEKDQAAKGKKKVVLNGGIPVIAEWAKVLQAAEKKPDWFSMIRGWAFIFSPRVERDLFSNRLVENGKGFVVTVNFSKRRVGGLFWDASVEIHHSPLCVLPSYQEYGACKVQTVPAWMNDPVIAITEAAKGKNVAEKMITNLAHRIRQQFPNLVGLRCEELLQSAGPYCDG